MPALYKGTKLREALFASVIGVGIRPRLAPRQLNDPKLRTEGMLRSAAGR